MNVLWDRLSREGWCREARRFADYSLYQHWDYGVELSRGIGRAAARIAVENGGRIGAMAQCRIKRLPFTAEGVVEVDGGPLWERGNGRDVAALSALVAELSERFVGRRGLALRITPPLRHASVEALCEVLASVGFKRSSKVRAYRTVCVDLRDDLGSIRKGLRQKWRNSLNSAERNGLVITCTRSGEAFRVFEKIYWDMRRRKRFPTGVRVSCIRRVQEQMPGQDKLIVSLAYAGGVCVAGHVAAAFGDTCLYFLGASTEAGLRCKAGYALQWAVLREAKVLGCAWYDLGGINAEEIPGVTRFKRGIGGIEIEAPGQFDLAPRGRRWSCYVGAERGYRFLRSFLQGKQGVQRVTDGAPGLYMGDAYCE